MIKIEKFKDKKMLLIFIIVLLVVVGIIFAANQDRRKEFVSESAAGNQDKTKENNVKIEEEYRSGVRKVFSKLVEFEKKDEKSTATISEIKTELLNLRVPKEYKNLHVNILFSILKIEQYVSGGNPKEKAESEQYINRAKEENPWLN